MHTQVQLSSIISQVQVYHLASSPVKIERVSCTYRYSVYSWTERLDASSTLRSREVSDSDIDIGPPAAGRVWILGEALT